MAYRATPNKRTGLTPMNSCLAGRFTCQSISRWCNPLIGSEYEYVENLRIRFENTYDLARENLGTSAVHQRRYNDMKAIDEPYRPGDLVCLENKAYRKGICPKLQKKWLGSVLVIQKLNDVTYRIRLSKVDTKVMPYEQLKSYRGDTVPKWAKAFRNKLIQTGPDEARNPDT